MQNIDESAAIVTKTCNELQLERMIEEEKANKKYRFDGSPMTKPSKETRKLKSRMKERNRRLVNKKQRMAKNK